MPNRIDLNFMKNIKGQQLRFRLVKLLSHIPEYEVRCRQRRSRLLFIQQLGIYASDIT